MKIPKILGENFFRKDLNLKNKWWHRLISILFVFLFFISVISAFVEYFDGNGFAQWRQTNTLKDRISSDVNTVGSLVKQGEKLEEIGASDYTLNLNDLTYNGYVASNAYCSTEIQNHIEDIKYERKIDHLFITNLYNTKDVSIEDFSKYINENAINCINVNAYTAYDNAGQETGKLTFLEPDKKFQNDWAFYEKSIPKTVLYLLGYALWIVVSFLLIFVVIAVIYYKILLYIIFGKTTNKAPGEEVKRNDTMKLNQYAKPIIIISIIIILLLGVSFYWLGIRPSNIRTQCSGVAGRSATNGEYVDCLRRNGLEDDSSQSLNSGQLESLQQGVNDQSTKIDSLQTQTEDLQKNNLSAQQKATSLNTQIIQQQQAQQDYQADQEYKLKSYQSCVDLWTATDGGYIKPEHKQLCR